jgi:hypothetical protein
MPRFLQTAAAGICQVTSVVASSASYVVPLTVSPTPTRAAAAYFDDRYIGSNANGRVLPFRPVRAARAGVWGGSRSRRARQPPAGERRRATAPPNALNTAVAIARRGNR